MVSAAHSSKLVGISRSFGVGGRAANLRCGFGLSKPAHVEDRFAMAWCRFYISRTSCGWHLRQHLEAAQHHGEMRGRSRQNIARESSCIVRDGRQRRMEDVEFDRERVLDPVVEK